jgi:hypothetical protein
MPDIDMAAVTGYLRNLLGEAAASRLENVGMTPSVGRAESGFTDSGQGRRG